MRDIALRPGLLLASMLLWRPPYAAAKPPREVAAEELLEAADGWLLDFDETEDGKLSLEEMEPLVQAMAEGSSDPRARAGALNASTLMGLADGDGDNLASRDELVHMLRRMKSFDGGHSGREAAATPGAAKPGSAGYGESHEERTRRKVKRRASRRKLPSDEL